MKPRIYVALSTFAQEGLGPLDLLKSSGYDFQINPTGKRLDQNQIIDLVQNFDGVVAGLEPYDAAVLNALPRLKCISRCGVGIDNVHLETARVRGIQVLNTPNVVITPVAEMTLALIFDCLRKITTHTQLMRQGKWERLVGFQLAGKTVGIIGLGRIGRKVAQLLRGLEAKVVAFDIAADQSWAKHNGVELVNLPTLLMTSDIITIHVAGAAGGASFGFGAAEFSAMKKGAFLINTSRGNFIDEEALRQALSDGHLAGAGLDVFAHEPYQGPLVHLPNVVLTPHCSTLTQESRLAMETEAVHNILEFFRGQSK